MKFVGTTIYVIVNQTKVQTWGSAVSATMNTILLKPAVYAVLCAKMCKRCYLEKMVKEHPHIKVWHLYMPPHDLRCEKSEWFGKVPKWQNTEK